MFEEVTTAPHHRGLFFCCPKAKEQLTYYTNIPHLTSLHRPVSSRPSPGKPRCCALQRRRSRPTKVSQQRIIAVGAHTTPLIPCDLQPCTISRHDGYIVPAPTDEARHLDIGQHPAVSPQHLVAAAPAPRPPSVHLRRFQTRICMYGTYAYAQRHHSDTYIFWLIDPASCAAATGHQPSLTGHRQPYTRLVSLGRRLL